MGKKPGLNKNKKSGIYRKLQKLTGLTAVVVGACLALCGFFYVRYVCKEQVRNELLDVCNAANGLMNEKYPGDYSLMQDDSGAYRLFKGDADISYDYDSVDMLKKLCNADMTLFYGDMRVLTTLKNEEEDRLSGTYANEEISGQVIYDNKNVFVSNADIYGVSYFALYVPLINSEGECVGMLSAGRPVGNTFDYAVYAGLLLFAVSIVIALCSGFICRSEAADISDVLGKETAYLGQVVNGNLRASLDGGILKRDDELGELGRFTVHVQKYIREMTERDTLTRLYTRRIGERKIAHVQNSLEEQGVRYCVCMGDIDFFKKFNDTYGHDCGDLVLRETASIFNESMVGHGFVIRWGGEEFLMIFEDSKPDAALEHLKLMRKKVLDNRLEYDGQSLHITMTFGLVEGDLRDINDIIKEADELLYYGKEHGRDQIVTKDMINMDSDREA